MRATRGDKKLFKGGGEVCTKPSPLDLSRAFMGNMWS
jgi:hypothetical protein